jgi:hypothetical protein
MFRLAQMSADLGRFLESKLLYNRIIKFWKDQGDVHQLAVMLIYASDVSRKLELFEIARRDIEVAWDILEAEVPGDDERRAQCLVFFASILNVER